MRGTLRVRSVGDGLAEGYEGFGNRAEGLGVDDVGLEVLSGGLEGEGVEEREPLLTRVGVLLLLVGDRLLGSGQRGGLGGELGRVVGSVGGGDLGLGDGRNEGGLGILAILTGLLGGLLGSVEIRQLLLQVVRGGAWGRLDLQHVGSEKARRSAGEGQPEGRCRAELDKES